jgi:hypothetical protein
MSTSCSKRPFAACGASLLAKRLETVNPLQLNMIGRPPEESNHFLQDFGGPVALAIFGQLDCPRSATVVPAAFDESHGCTHRAK